MSDALAEKAYTGLAITCGAISFIGCWAALSMQFGLLGILLGWIPAILAGSLGVLFGPIVLALAAILGVFLFVLARHH